MELRRHKFEIVKVDASTPYIQRPKKRNAPFNVLFSHRPDIPDCYTLAYLTKWPTRKTFGVVVRMPEKVEENGLGQRVELGECGAARGPQRLRPIQHLRNPQLLGNRW